MARLEWSNDELVGFPQPRSEKIETLWEEYRAALLVQRRVRTAEVVAEVERARRAFQEEFNSSCAGVVPDPNIKPLIPTLVATDEVQK